MKEIIYNIDNATAGRVITITGLDEASLGEDNVLGIINKTTKKVLYAPTVGALASVSYSSGTLTITLANSVTAITAGDKLLIKLYSDSPIDIDTSDLAKEGSVARIISTKVPTVMECSYYLGATFVRVGYEVGYYKWLRVDGYDMYLYTPSAIEIGVPCYSSINPQVEVGVVTFLKTVTLDGVAQESTLTQGVQDIRDDISHIDIDTSDLAKQGTNPDATLSEVQAKIGTPSQGQSPTLFGAIGDVVQQVVQGVINETSVNATYDGVVYQQPYEGRSPLEVFTSMRYVISIIDDVITETPNLQSPFRFNELAFLQYIKLSKCAKANSILTFNNCRANEIDVPVLETAYHSTFNTCPNLKKINMPLFNPVSQYAEFGSTPNLIDIITGAKFDHSILFFNTWSPTNALLSNSQSLLTPEDIAAGFTSNLEKLLYNIREHMAANLPDRTGQSALTLTMSAAVKAAINGDTATANAFANKNWIIA